MVLNIVYRAKYEVDECFFSFLTHEHIQTSQNFIDFVLLALLAAIVVVDICKSIYKRNS